MKAFILAGGKGTRLSSITKGEIPKPMAVICGKPIIEWVILNLKKNGITDIIISVSHLKEVIFDFVKDGSPFGVNVSYVVEDEPLGSGGSLFLLKDKVDGDFIVCPGDAVFDINVEKMATFHRQKGALITLFAHPNLHPYDSDLIIANSDGLVTDFSFKNATRDFYYKNCVNAGIMIINSKALEGLTQLRKMNIEHDFVFPLITSKKVYAYLSTEYVKDVGTSERFEKTTRDILAGIPQKKNLNNKQKAIFLDRDGTINTFEGFVKKAEDIRLLQDVERAIGLINQSEYLTIIVSNQPVIARGESTFDEVEKMFNKIETLLGKEGVYVDGRYYCPHHPHSGFEGEIKELKFDCDCRKPKIGMLEKASVDFNLDLSQCIMVGDSERDVLTGKNAGIKTVRVTTGEQFKEGDNKPDYTATSLLDAVQWILGK